ncbi:MAG: TonB-dependent receptor [Mangrovibacterium sp.]
MFRWISFFMLLSIMHVSGAVFSQETISISQKNITIRQALNEIEQKTNFKFLYRNENIDVNKVISLDVENADIGAVLKAIFSDRDFSYQMFENHVIALNIGNSRQIAGNMQQNHKVTGKVTDSSGIPLPGVTVIIKGTTQGTITDDDGNYILTDVPADAILVFSFVGMKTQEIAVNNQNPLSVTLEEDTRALADVVVIGFGTQKKVNLTGSVSTVNATVLEAVPVRNAVQALQGQVPGLLITQSSGQLNANPGMQIRGLNTIGQGSSGGVLVLIDGMEGDIYSLNPQDIENISVLKDAAASSIYGSRAPFGVILVTTKKGKEGKATINYNNNFRFNMPINMPQSADSYSWALFFNDGAHNDGHGDDISPARLQRIKDYIDGKISYNTIPVGNQWGTAYTEGNDNIDYYDVFFRDVTTAQEHNLSIAGGNEKMNYYVSGNYLDESGVLHGDLDGLERLSFFGKVEARPLNILGIQYSSRYVRENYHQPTQMNNDIFQYFGQYLWPVAPLYDPNGILFNDVVLRFRNGGQMETSNTSSVNQFSATLEPLKGWRIVGDLNYRYRSYFNHIVSKPVWQTCIDGVTRGSVWDEHSKVTEDVGRNDYLNVNAYTDYEYTFANKHYFKVMAGFQAEQYNTRGVTAGKEGLVVPDIATINTASGMFNGETVPPTVAGDFGKWTTAGFFGRLNYNLMEKYLFEANLRYDGSSRFRSDKRWGFFPSYSVGYNIARENFFQPLTSYVNTLKLRASYGSLGNQNTNSWYPTYEAMGYSNVAGTWLIDGQKQNIAWPPSLISSSLTWEEVRSWNVALDFGLLDNRLTGSFDYFVRKTLNMVGPAEELPIILGTSVPNTNNTDLKTKGFELEVVWRDRAFNQQLNYGVRLILSDAQAEITHYSNPSGTLSKYYAGMKVGQIWGYESIGIARSDEEMAEHLATMTNGGQSYLGADWQAGDIMYRDVDGNGRIDWGSSTISDHGDLVVIGNTTPRYSFGVDVTAEWKGIDFRMFLQGVAKRDYFQGSKYFFGSSGWSKWGTMVLKQHLDYFRDDPDHPLGLNINSYYPRPYLDNSKNVQTQTLYLQNAAYMRLKNLQVGYTLPNSITGKVGVSRLRIYLSGENLFTVTSMTDLFDPETIGSNSQGNVYPLTKTYSAGLSVTF